MSCCIKCGKHGAGPYCNYCQGERNLTEKINTMDRYHIVGLLEGIGIACYDDESTAELREALQESVEGGDISEEDLE